MWSWFRWAKSAGEAGWRRLGLTGPQADEVLERLGLPGLVDADDGHARGVERD